MSTNPYEVRELTDEDVDHILKTLDEDGYLVDEDPYPYDEPVVCPNGHPTGRQDPLYQSGHGWPIATGDFECQVCRLRYRP